jgi:hypothetical protein
MKAIGDPPVGQRQVLRTYFPLKIEGEGLSEATITGRPTEHPDAFSRDVLRPETE